MDTHMNHGNMTTTANKGGHAHSDPAKQSEHSAAHNLITSKNATHTAIKSGSWFDASTWKGGRVPGANAKVVIPKGLKVKYDDVSDTRLFGLRVDGQLDFATNADTKMVIDTFVVSSDGTLTIGTKKNPVQGNVKTEILIANNGKINTKWDPQQLSRGIVSHGAVSIHGQEKTSHLKVSVDPSKGDSTLVLQSSPDNWKVGDRIVLTGTQYMQNGTQDEERTITGIKGNRIILDKPLTYDHGTPKANLKAYVANQSRNIVITTENANKLPSNQRGHVMFMHSDDVDVRYAEFNELGRTDKSKLLDDFALKGGEFSPQRVLDKNGDPIAGKRTNIRGRYAVHLHRTGVNGKNDPAVLIGNSVIGSPGWGMVQHDSHAVLENNLSYDVFGSGFVTETGNEIGAWRNNIAIKTQGRDVHEKFGSGNHDLGFSGNGFWFQGRLVHSEGNVAAGSSNAGIFYFHRGVDQINISADNLPVEAWARGKDSVHPDESPIMGFRDNEVIASRNGLRVIKSFQRQWHDGRTVLDGLKAWEVMRGTELEYTAHYTLKDFTVIGSDQAGSGKNNIGIHLGKNTEDIVVDNLKAEGFKTGVTLTKKVSGANQLNDWGYVFVDTQLANNNKNWENLNPKTDRLLSKKDINPGQLKFAVDNAKSDFVIDKSANGAISVVGTKTDSLGSIKVPFGNEKGYYTFQAARDLAKDGYYTLPNGKHGVVIDEYISDRLTGDVRKYSFVVTFQDKGMTKNARHLGTLDPSKVKQSGAIIPLEALEDKHVAKGHSHHTPKHTPSGGDDMTNHTPADHHSPNDHSPSTPSTPAIPSTPVDNTPPTDETVTDGGADNVISGTGANDSIKGTNGNDTINAGGGSDSISGNKGNDSISGGWGWDTINGGAGNDTIDGGAGKDTMTGGTGRDVFVFKKETQVKDDVITDFQTGVDQLDVTAVTAFSALDTDGNGTVDGKFIKKLGNGIQLDLSSFKGSRIQLNKVSSLSKGNFVLRQTTGTGGNAPTGNGSTGSTTNNGTVPTVAGKKIVGNKGKNSLTGTAGDDTIDGLGGDDVILGGNGNDIILGNWGTDNIEGGAGNDTISGGPGKDIMSGGTGADVFVFGKEKHVKLDVITDFERGVDKLDVRDLVSFGALDVNKDGLVDKKFVTAQGSGLTLDLSASGGTTVSLNNVSALSSADFV